MKKKLGILLTTSPQHQNTHTVIQLGKAALSAGIQVKIFLMCDGVYHENHAEFLTLADNGAELALCSQSAKDRAVKDSGKIKFGSQYDLAVIVNEADRFLAFN